ncbi:hypothetical protein [Metaclostridioides mangenotii]|uniref:Uncharacterized protein n=1 Tax=Metaclostridioides mangenotii TaxID=1540 RepID=A0ABS4EBQ8_9FIRM|nr:hypothetical protein [Clostridioides mangenotii]MBP1855376.1 hypothetical protein [Clostridioides mangenotii]
MDKLKESIMIVDSNINTAEEMLKDNEIRLSEIKCTAIKYCSRDEGKIENQQLVVNDLKSQLKMAKTIKKGLVLIQEREEQKEKSRSNDSIQDLQKLITLIIPQEA